MEGSTFFSRPGRTEIEVAQRGGYTVKQTTVDVLGGRLKHRDKAGMIQIYGNHRGFITFKQGVSPNFFLTVS